MSEEWRKAFELMLVSTSGPSDNSYEQRRVIINDLLWKLVRRDWHGVCDCANDLRELHL